MGVPSPTNGQTLIDAASDIMNSLSNQVRLVMIIWNEYTVQSFKYLNINFYLWKLLLILLLKFQFLVVEMIQTSQICLCSFTKLQFFEIYLYNFISPEKLPLTFTTGFINCLSVNNTIINTRNNNSLMKPA